MDTLTSSETTSFILCFWQWKQWEAARQAHRLCWILWDDLSHEPPGSRTRAAALLPCHCEGPFPSCVAKTNCI